MENSKLGSDNFPQKQIGPFRLGRFLGKGNSGTTFMGTHIESGFKVALKITKKSSLDKKPERWAALRREIAAMRLMDHANVLKLYDVFETPKTVVMALELAPGGELFTYLERGVPSRKTIIRLFAQITLGLLHCHQHGITHRDLKPENLLLDERMNIKIADFGMARFTLPGVHMKTTCGSLHYVSPEVLDGKYDGKIASVWSLGVILYALSTGCLPFQHQSLPILLKQIRSGRYPTPFVDADFQDLIKKMIQLDVKKRIAMEDILSHPTFQGSGYYGASVGPDCRISCKMEEMLDDQLINDVMALAETNDRNDVTAKIHQKGDNLEKSLYFLSVKRKFDRHVSLSQLSPLAVIPLPSSSLSSSSSLSPLMSTPNSRVSTASSLDVLTLDLGIDRETETKKIPSPPKTIRSVIPPRPPPPSPMLSQSPSFEHLNSPFSEMIIKDNKLIESKTGNMIMISEDQKEVRTVQENTDVCIQEDLLVVKNNDPTSNENKELKISEISYSVISSSMDSLGFPPSPSSPPKLKKEKSEKEDQDQMTTPPVQTRSFTSRLQVQIIDDIKESSHGKSSITSDTKPSPTTSPSSSPTPVLTSLSPSSPLTQKPSRKGISAFFHRRFSSDLNNKFSPSAIQTLRRLRARVSGSSQHSSPVVQTLTPPVPQSPPLLQKQRHRRLFSLDEENFITNIPTTPTPTTPILSPTTTTTPTTTSSSSSGSNSRDSHLRLVQQKFSDFHFLSSLSPTKQ